MCRKTSVPLSVTAIKVRFDGTYAFQLGSVSGSRITTSAGDYYTYLWTNPVSPSGYPSVYGDDYTDLTLATSIPSTMQVVTTGPDPAPITVEMIDSKTAKVKYLSTGCGYGAGYVLITGENGVSKLVTVGVMESLKADIEQYPTSMGYRIGDIEGSCTFRSKEDATSSPVQIKLGQSVSISSIGHSYNPHYDVHNTIGEVENAAVEGCSLPANLTGFKGMTITPNKTGLVLLPIKCRKVDGSYGSDEIQYIAIKVN